MRVVAGTLRGRRLLGPETDDVRPTSDRLRETLFNVLGPSIVGARVLDGFGGTAAVAIEALSRGASHATVYEQASRALKVAKENITRCGLTDTCVLVRGDFLATQGRADCDLVFLDPPYDIDDLPRVVAVGAAHLAPEGRLVLEHRRARPTPEAVGDLSRVRVLEAGDSALSFYR
jgi:16S rRNA (guanine966-N2)-methyltransferase